ncbi:MAG: hypothetical protein ABW185_03675 [Sedimenticola sp.]
MVHVINDVLQGPDENKTFVHDIAKLSVGRYELAGRLVAFAILHGGPGIPVLNKNVYRMLTGRAMAETTDIDCVVNVEAKSALTKVPVFRNVISQ